VEHEVEVEERLPTREQYLKGLKALGLTMPPKHRQMLIEHYRAPGHTITADALAKKVGYKNYSAVNLQYGTLGFNLVKAMGWSTPPDAQASCSIAYFLPPDGEHTEWRWVMHDPLVEALEELRWV
jgi:hypothetical protein